MPNIVPPYGYEPIKSYTKYLNLYSKVLGKLKTPETIFNTRKVRLNLLEKDSNNSLL